jgi:DNA polymerase III subunit gamma/tau
MASQSLYRKWRSQNFSELVGQEPIIQTLKNALHEGTLAHAYLFTGPRGTGKTSTARLLAKTINCPNAKNGEPCNTCELCREITNNQSLNVIEIDAASNRGIDSVRDLREQVKMLPTKGAKYKVFILDEAHMLTTEAFNALLKTLEEPPPHAIFVLATTDVHKLLPTVLSRCQRFDFKRITTQQIVQHLDFVAQQEQVELEPSAAALIARAAAGGMRDALSLLDQAIAYAGQHVSLPQVQAMLGVADPRAIQKFIFHIAQMDSAAGLHLINELVEAGADLNQVNKQAAEFWRAMMLTKAGADLAAIIDGTSDEVDEIKQAAALFSLEELTECARIFAQNDLVQKNQGTPQLGLELALLNSIALHNRALSGQSAPQPRAVGARFTAPTAPVAPTTPVVSHIPTTPIAPSTPIASNRSAAPNTSQPPVHQEIAAAPLAAVPAAPQENANEKQSEELPDWDGVPSYADEEGYAEPTPVVEAATKPVVTVAEPVANNENSGPPLTLDDVKERWEYVKRRVKTKKSGAGAKIAALLNGCNVVRIEGTEIHLLVIVAANAAFHYTALQKKEDQEVVEWALKIELGRECSLRLLPPGSAGGGIPAVIPSPNVPPMSNRAASAAPALAPSRSAHVERPTPTPAPQDSVASPRIAPHAQEKQRTPAQEKHGTAVASNPSVPIPVQRYAPTLARNPVVRENSRSDLDVGGENVSPLVIKESATTRLELVTKNAQHDPVVQEVVRMFKAEIKDVHLK